MAQKEYCLATSIEDYVDLSIADTNQRLRRANIMLCSELRKAYEPIIRGILPSSLSVSEGEVIQELGVFLICNASDSLIEKYSSTLEDYIVEVSITTNLSSDILNLEIEDNGKGIEPDIEPLLFKHLIGSPKRRLNYFHGKLGIDLFKFRTIIKERGGEVYFHNKGANNGAAFGYKLPVN